MLTASISNVRCVTLFHSSPWTSGTWHFLIFIAKPHIDDWLEISIWHSVLVKNKIWNPGKQIQITCRQMRKSVRLSVYQVACFSVKTLRGREFIDSSLKTNCLPLRVFVCGIWVYVSESTAIISLRFGCLGSTTVSLCCERDRECNCPGKRDIALDKW